MLPVSPTGRIFILAGAGVSAESGIPTFRDVNGLWRNYKGNGTKPTDRQGEQVKASGETGRRNFGPDDLGNRRLGCLPWIELSRAVSSFDNHNSLLGLYTPFPKGRLANQ